MDNRIIEDRAGRPLYVLVPVPEFEALQQAADDLRALKAVARSCDRGAQGAETVPLEIAHRIAMGENPVRVWRVHRGLRAVELARAAGLSPAYLSEIETGKKDGTFKTMALLARCLGVALDDLAPLEDDSERAARARQIRLDLIRAEAKSLEALISHAGAFDTAAVRRAAQSLQVQALNLVAEEAMEGTRLSALLRHLEEILTLVQQAESQIVDTAYTIRQELRRLVAEDAFQDPFARLPSVPRDKAQTTATG